MRRFICLLMMILSCSCLAAEETAASSFFVTGLVCRGGYWFYKKFITSQDGMSCPYNPSCSSFMLASVEQKGVTGIILGLDRLNRCSRNENRLFLYQRDSNWKLIDLPGEKIDLSPEFVVKSPGRAAVLSAFIPGAGQLYLGNKGRAFHSVFTVGAFGGAAAYTAKRYGAKNWRPWLYGSLAGIFYITDIYGSYHEAELYNLALYRKLFLEEEKPLYGPVPQSQNQELPQLKNPGFAMALSVIPGLGQTYAGDWKDGINAFVLNGLIFGACAYSIFTGDWITFVLLESDPLFKYYRGNFRNAKKAAEKYNAVHQVENQVLMK